MATRPSSGPSTSTGRRRSSRLGPRRARTSPARADGPGRGGTRPASGSGRILPGSGRRTGRCGSIQPRRSTGGSKKACSTRSSAWAATRAPSACGGANWARARSGAGAARLEGLARSLPSSPAVEGPLELDVPVGRAVTAFYGRAHTVLSDYSPWGTSVRSSTDPCSRWPTRACPCAGRIDPRTGEIELEITEAVATPPFPRRATTLGTRRDGAGERATIEVPERSSRGAVVRLAGTKGDAWLVGLGAAGARPSSSSGMRCPARGAGDRPGDGRAPRASPRLPRTRRRGRSSRAPSSVRRPETSTSDSSVPRGRRARRDGRAAPRRDRKRSAARGVVRLRSHLGGGPPVSGRRRRRGSPGRPARRHVRARPLDGRVVDREAYDVVLSVAEPLEMRDGPSVLTYGEPPTLSPCRLPSFRRALVPLRIVVPHGDVGRRTVMLDLGRGSSPGRSLSPAVGARSRRGACVGSWSPSSSESSSGASRGAPEHAVL